MEIKIKNSSLVAIIDAEDYDKIKNYTWRLARSKRTGYDNIYVNSHINVAKYKIKTVYLHRIIMDCPAGMAVDHINGDTLDNRKSNLRICTRRENSLNRHRYTRAT